MSGPVPSSAVGRARGRPVVFWWVSPSIHMEPCLRTFPAHWFGRTLAVWCAPLSRDRRTLGWRAADTGDMPQVTLPADDVAARTETARIIGEYPGAIHVYGGWVGNERTFAAFRGSARDHSSVHVVVAEPFRGWGVRRYVRHARAFVYTLPYRSRLDAVLAMGEAGVGFYRQIGFSARRVFPFIYQSPQASPPGTRPVSDPLRLVYVGRLDHRKGVQDLLRALARLRERSWTLDVIGDGARRTLLEDLARALRIDDRTRWRGVLAHDELVTELPEYDVTVVPSRFDGWGVVTNEALQAGLAVVVSDRTASSDLIHYSGAGKVFRAGDTGSLAAGLEALLTQPSAVFAMKQAAGKYAPTIGGDAVSGYLAEVLEGVAIGDLATRPTPPWAPAIGPSLGRQAWSGA